MDDIDADVDAAAGRPRTRSGSGLPPRAPTSAAVPPTTAVAALPASPAQALPPIDVAVTTVNQCDLTVTLHDGSCIQLTFSDIAVAHAALDALILDGALHPHPRATAAAGSALPRHLFCDRWRMAAEPNLILTCTSLHVPLVAQPLQPHAAPRANLYGSAKAPRRVCATQPP